VRITASGLLNGAPHLMHIHAQGQGTCPTGTAATHHNGHLAISTQDGAPFYGHPFTALTVSGSTGEQNLFAFAHFPTSGTIHYRRTIDLGPVIGAAVRQNTSAVIIIHGIDYNHNGRYDFASLGGDREHNTPLEKTAPALCGQLTPQGHPRGASASAPRTYTATLVAAPAQQHSSAPALLCNLRTLAGDLL
jgi:hypothetical protein